MAAFYISLDSNFCYQFNAPSDAYPAAVATALGVLTAAPANSVITTAGTYADYAIVRVRIKVKLAGGAFKSVSRLCDVTKLDTARSDISGAAAFGGTCESVNVSRKRIYL